MLSDAIITSNKPATKPYKIQDDEGMYLLVMPNGSKYFRYDYREDNKRKTLALGVYPQISLDSARAKRDEFRRRLKSGVDAIKIQSLIQSLSTEQLQKEVARRGCGIPIEQDAGQEDLVIGKPEKPPMSHKYDWYINELFDMAKELTAGLPTKYLTMVNKALLNILTKMQKDWQTELEKKETQLTNKAKESLAQKRRTG
jgi:hypothetical protein